MSLCWKSFEAPNRCDDNAPYSAAVLLFFEMR
jgi:hypothetical protein